MALHLYAIVLADHAVPDRTGVRDEGLGLVRSGGLAAVVSPVEPDADVTDADALAHLDVITSLLATGPLVPMRFGTIAPDADAVRQEVLDASRADFEEYLHATRDLVEVLVTVQFHEDAALRDIMSHDARLGDASRHAESMAERISLGEGVAERLVAAVREWSDELVRPAFAHAEAVTSLDTPEHTSARYALLVQRDRLADVDTEMSRLPSSVAHGAVPYDVEYVGPLPPLDFSLETTADDGGSSPWGW
jgi:hypothetical protein